METSGFGSGIVLPNCLLLLNLEKVTLSCFHSAGYKVKKVLNMFCSVGFSFKVSNVFEKGLLGLVSYCKNI